MFLGYNTNGFSSHRIEDAVAVLSDIGYTSIALTLDHQHIDPPDRRGVAGALRRLAPLLRGTADDGRKAESAPDRARLRVTIETGAGYVLDGRRKPFRTLLSSTAELRRVRGGFLNAAIDVAGALAADSVSFWSGTADDEADESICYDRLAAGIGELLERAEPLGVRLSFEPEPGMFIDTMDRFAELHRLIDHPLFGLTLDVGHVHCLGDGCIAEHIRRWRNVLWNVHIEDMMPGRHEHLMFGEGTIDFAAIFAVLTEIEYDGPVHVELSRHSHDAVDVARRSFEFLSRFLGDAASGC